MIKTLFVLNGTEGWEFTVGEEFPRNKQVIREIYECKERYVVAFRNNSRLIVKTPHVMTLSE
ncbi:hypothetical protein [Cytobacillus gottheilii]|uniref:hypothetical protein n=1 Tax=Cytobacillus gottheilii TaxID=859144 RepID=UPI0009BBFE7F|nr:hypothetical protein [Cytobacillus gottheilii]